MKLTVNGKVMELEGPVLDKRIVDFLRNDLELTGVKNACDIGACGACTILLNNEAVRVCPMRVRDCEDCEILTIEGMAAPGGSLHPLQQAFIDAGAIQCGFCTPGMVLAAHALLLRNPHPTRAEIRRAIHANLCRCTGYQQIVDAVEMAAVWYDKAGQKTPE
jgi:carbon-monoxide dehydrogenase small subunit